MSYQKISQALGTTVRRIERWKNTQWSSESKEQHTKPYNAMTPQEKTAIQEIVGDEKHADESTRGLSVRLMEEQGIYVSHVSIWEYQRSIAVSGHRGHRRNQSKRPEKPDTDFAQGPNELWSWDITKLKTSMAYVFFYLVAILDTWSRKTVGWYVSDRETSDIVRCAWDIALVNEELTQKDAYELPQSLSDRGSQMRSIPTTLFFRKLGITQLYSRPRTPNDNAKCEALFSTVKTAPAYPGIFQTMAQAIAYFDVFFPWYNEKHLHTALEMMTPEDWHTGRYVRIRAERERVKQETFARRRIENLGTYSIKNNTKNATLLD